VGEDQEKNREMPSLQLKSIWFLDKRSGEEIVKWSSWWECL